MSSQETNYAETLCDKILSILKIWNTANRFKMFYYGDPGEIPTDSMPAVIISKASSNVGVEDAPTRTDRVSETIEIILVVNKKTYMDDFDEDTVSWQKMLELMIEGNNPVTFEYDPTTIFGVLRTNYTLGNFLLGQNMRVKYGTVPRNGPDDDWTGEAHITFTASHFQATPDKI